jgi:uncharacterized membrane protein
MASSRSSSPSWVLELKAPHGADLHALAPLWPVFLSYVLSFIYIGIYWNKHQYGSYPSSQAWSAWHKFSLMRAMIK